MKEEINTTEVKDLLKKLLTCAYIVIALLAVNTIISLTQSSVSSESSESTEKTGTEENIEYDVSMFDTVDSNKVVDLFDSEKTQVIYIGRSTCGYCVQFLPVLQKAQEDYGYTTKYLDITTVTTEGQNALLAKDNDEKFLETNYGATPVVLLVKDGKLVDGWVGYAEYDTFASFLEENGFKK